MDQENEERQIYNCTLAGKNNILQHIELIENMLKCSKCNELPTEEAVVYVKNDKCRHQICKGCCPELLENCPVCNVALLPPDIYEDNDNIDIFKGLQTIRNCMSQMTLVEAGKEYEEEEEEVEEDDIGLENLQTNAPLDKDAENNSLEFDLAEPQENELNQLSRSKEKEKENEDLLPDVGGKTTPEIEKTLSLNIRPLSEKNFNKASASSPVKIVNTNPLILGSPESRPNMSIDEDVLKELPEDIRLEIENERENWIELQKKSARIDSKKNPTGAGAEKQRILNRPSTSAGRSRILEEKPKTQSRRKPPAPKNSSKVIFSARDLTAAVAENAKNPAKKRLEPLASDSEGSSTDEVSTSQKSEFGLVKHSTPLNSDSKGSLSEIPPSQPISPVRKKSRFVFKRAVKQSAKKSKLSQDSDDDTKTPKTSSVMQSSNDSKLSKNSDDIAKTSEASVKKSSERKNSLTNRSKLNKKNKKGETPLHSACCKFDFESVKHYLEEGAEVNTQDNNRWTPLHEVVIKKDAIELVKILLEHEANPNVPGGDLHSTPLHEAASHGCVDVCKLLIQKGASKIARDANFNTPIDVAFDQETEKAMEETECEMGDTQIQEMDDTVRMNSSEDQEHYVLYCHGLSSSQKAQVCKTKDKKFDYVISSKMTEEVTHVITNVDEGSRKCSPDLIYLTSILMGKYVVDISWFENSSKCKTGVHEDEFAAKSCRDSSINALANSKSNSNTGKPRLFDGCYIYLQGQFKDPYWSKSDIINLLKSGGATILRREPDPEGIPPEEKKIPYHVGHGSTSELSQCAHFIIYQEGPKEPKMKYKMVHIKSLPMAWLVECIKCFSMVDPEPWIG